MLYYRLNLFYNIIMTIILTIVLVLIIIILFLVVFLNKKESFGYDSHDIQGPMRDAFSRDLQERINIVSKF